jgi:hypothetical protein
MGLLHDSPQRLGADRVGRDMARETELGGRPGEQVLVRNTRQPGRSSTRSHTRDASSSARQRFSTDYPHRVIEPRLVTVPPESALKL